MSAPEKMEIENVNIPGKIYRVDAEKYKAMRKCILEVTPDSIPGMTAKEMIESLRKIVPRNLWPNGEKVAWWQKTVQLDLEAKGILVREPNAKPLRWWKTSK